MRWMNRLHLFAFKAAAAFKSSRLLIVLSLLLIVGLFAGVMLSRRLTQEETDALVSLLNGFTFRRTEQAFATTFFRAFLSQLLMLAVLFLLGTSAVGVLAAPLFPVVRGMGLGLAMGYLYVSQGLKGIAFSVLLIIPPAILSSILFILASGEAAHFSLLLCRRFLPSSGSDASVSELRRYLTRFGSLLLLLSAGCLTDAICSAAFSGFFL